jgi:Ankyrin repeats (3 copies)
MDLARRDGVRCVVAEANFTWHRGILDLQPVRVMFFSSYDESVGQITDDAALEKFDGDGLTSSVQQAALDRVRQGSWFESPEHQHPARRGRVPASTVVVLYDDPWLPLPQVWFGTRDLTWSPLDDAAFMDDQVAVKRLLEEKKIKRKDLDRALGIAVGGDSVAAIHLLLDGGANVNARINGDTALTIAVANDRPRSVGVLLKAGANPNSRNKEGTPLAIAIQRHYEEVAAILRQAGARE